MVPFRQGFAGVRCDMSGGVRVRWLGGGGGLSWGDGGGGRAGIGGGCWWRRKPAEWCVGWGEHGSGSVLSSCDGGVRGERGLVGGSGRLVRGLVGEGGGTEGRVYVANAGTCVVRARIRFLWAWDGRCVVWVCSGAEGGGLEDGGGRGGGRVCRRWTDEGGRGWVREGGGGREWGVWPGWVYG